MVSPRAEHGNVEEEYAKEGRESTKTNDGRIYKQKGRKLYTVRRKHSAVAKFNEYGGNLAKATRDSRVPRRYWQQWVKQREELEARHL